jgi:hypothetical protein
VFTDAIVTHKDSSDIVVGVRYGGPERLFMITSALFAWALLAVTERALGVVGTIAAACSAILGVLGVWIGFGMALLVMGELPNAVWTMMGYSIVTLVGVVLVRSFLADLV